MQEAPLPPAAPSGFRNKVTWLGMILAALIGGILSVIALCVSIDQIGEARITLPSKYNLYGTISIENRVNSFTGKTEGSGTVSGYVRPSYYYGVSFDRPGKPWLCIASVISSAAILATLRRTYQIIRRRKSALKEKEHIGMIAAGGGLMFFAGAETHDGSFLIGIWVMAHAGIDYLAYTHWERVRSQLYKD